MRGLIPSTYVAKPPDKFGHIHRILGRAMRECDAALWPARPHLGGPLPILSTASQLRVALDLYDLVGDLIEDRAECDNRVALARGVARDEQLAHKSLDTASKSSKSDAVGTKIAKLVLRAAYNHRYAAPSARNVVGMCVENAAVAAVRAYTDERVRAFLRALDDAILRAELAAGMAERAFAASANIVRVVSRPPGSTKTAGLVMAELADGNFGLYVKLKQKWEWHEGDRATVFATVPDAYMRHVMADLDPGFKRTSA